ncbi:MAG TPA: NUDIX domain-containing protein [archaeon]|nr:NUDIX domain-containing protein [archaeon]
MVRVGVGVILLREGRVLLGKRKYGSGKGQWAFPGGHLELDESVEACAIRELKEETGLDLLEPRMGPFTNDIFDPESHYITLYVIADWTGGEPRNRESNKCGGWEWSDWDNLREPLFLPLQNLLKQGFDPRKPLRKLRAIRRPLRKLGAIRRSPFQTPPVPTKALNLYGI